MSCPSPSLRQTDVVLSSTREPDPRLERTRRAVLEAALDLLTEHGYGEVTIEAVAARSGVAKSTIYRHWPGGRTDLVRDAFHELKPPPIAPTDGPRARPRPVRSRAVGADGLWLSMVGVPSGVDRGRRARSSGSRSATPDVGERAPHPHRGARGRRAGRRVAQARPTPSSPPRPSPGRSSCAG